jgi:hypothetical protein
MERTGLELVINALLELYEMGREKRRELGEAGREWSHTKFGFDNFVSTWDETLTALHEKCGSWDTRKGYQKYEFKEIT